MMMHWLKSNHQTVTSLSAVLLSVVALYVAWDQSRVMRAQQHAAVWPAVQIQTQFSTREDGYIMLFNVKNDGIGPAVVEHVYAEMDGQPLLNWEQFGDRVPEGLGRPGMWTGSLRGEILAPGEESILAQLTWSRDGIHTNLIREYRSTLWSTNIEICYCSVYGRCWTVDNDRTEIQPEAVDQCPAADPDSNL